MSAHKNVFFEKLQTNKLINNLEGSNNNTKDFYDRIINFLNTKIGLFFCTSSLAA